MEKFSYTSIHEFLDEQFGHLAYVSDQMVRDAKYQYRLMYNRWYKQHYREKMVELTCAVSKIQSKKIREKAQERGVSLGKYLKERILETTGIDKNKLRRDILKALDVVEEYAYEKGIDLQGVITHLETIQKALI